MNSISTGTSSNRNQPKVRTHLHLYVRMWIRNPNLKSKTQNKPHIIHIKSINTNLTQPTGEIQVKNKATKRVEVKNLFLVEILVRSENQTQDCTTNDSLLHIH